MMLEMFLYYVDREKGITVKVRNVVLVGFMGTGKSTVGKKLAERLGWQFSDSDAVLEKKCSKRVFLNCFGIMEKLIFVPWKPRHLARILAGQHQVVATGGGAVLAEVNRLACWSMALLLL